MEYDFFSTLQQQQPHSKTPPKYVYLNGQPIIDEPCKVSSKGCVCVTSFKCCHVGGVSKVFFYSTILIDYSLEWLENDDIKVFFFRVPPVSKFHKKTLSHNLLSTCEKWNRFCGRYNTPCFLSQKMSLLLLKNFSFSCPSLGHVAIKI